MDLEITTHYDKRGACGRQCVWGQNLQSESEWLRDLQISLLRKRSSYGMALKKTGRARRMELKSTGSGRTYDT